MAVADRPRGDTRGWCRSPVLLQRLQHVLDLQLLLLLVPAVLVLLVLPVLLVLWLVLRRLVVLLLPLLLVVFVVLSMVLVVALVLVVVALVLVVLVVVVVVVVVVAHVVVLSVENLDVLLHELLQSVLAVLRVVLGLPVHLLRLRLRFDLWQFMDYSAQRLGHVGILLRIWRHGRCSCLQ